eukprot:Sspe_Gene.64928::Locus_38459_Transcript_1_1_Confidence_1.000_Length_977::g.64928::m.64928/K01637/E4.1.3.1, aceA; isocitrate lyase
METDTPNVKQAAKFAQGVHERWPNQFLAYNLSPSFNWDVAGLSEEEMGSFTRDLGKLGYVWQFCTLAGFPTATRSCATLHARLRAAPECRAYVEEIQRKEREFGVETLTHQEVERGARRRLFSTGLVNSLTSTGIMSRGSPRTSSRTPRPRSPPPRATRTPPPRVPSATSTASPSPPTPTSSSTRRRRSD